MKLSESLCQYKEWLLVGPMGPELPLTFLTLPSLAVDGGGNFAPNASVWVGDSDSNQTQLKVQQSFLFPEKKDQTDLTLALELLSQGKAQRLHLWGFLGGRLDHWLGNLGEAFRHTEKNQTEILFYHQTTLPSIMIFPSGRFSFLHHGLFSLMSLAPQKIKVTGDCEYTLQEATVLPPLSGLGISNLACGRVWVECQYPLAVIFPESP